MERNELAKRSRRSMTADEKLSYYIRLTKRYDSDSYFITQYLNADGHELEGKFFSPVSSSRLAFELYSFLAMMPQIKNFRFEKRLPGIRGSPKSPNMDVYFEYGDDIFFIESKYTETSPNSAASIPDAYYREIGEAHSKTTGKPLKSTLAQRFYGESEVAGVFSDFVRKVMKECMSPTIWFDIKQEVTHLFGIVFFMLNSGLKHRTVRFYNIVYRFDDFYSDISHIRFVELADEMIREVIRIKGLDFSFDYGVKTIQDDIIPLIPENQKAFGTDRTVSEMLRQFDL